jgi:tetratricopeptide (TPR) repeat protein
MTTPHPTSERQSLEDALDHARQAGDISTEAALLLKLGDRARHECEYELAQGLYAQSWDAYQRIHDLRGQAQALRCLAPIYYTLSRRDLAEIYFEQAIRLYEQTGDLAEVTVILHQLVDLHHGHPPDYAAQSSYYKRAIAHYETLNEPHKIADVFMRLGQMALVQRLYVLSAHYYVQGVAFYQACGRTDECRAAYEYLGDVLIQLHAFDLAKNAYSQALDLSPSDQRCLMQLAFISAITGKLTEGRAYAQQAFVLNEGKRDLDSLHKYIDNRHMWARLVYRIHPEEARQTLAEALDFAYKHPAEDLSIDIILRDLAAIDNKDPKGIERFLNGR